MIPNKGTNGIINRTQMETNELINNEAWIRKTAAEPQRQRTKVEPEGRRSLTEPELWRDKAKPEEWNPIAMEGEKLPKV